MSRNVDTFQENGKKVVKNLPIRNYFREADLNGEIPKTDCPKCGERIEVNPPLLDHYVNQKLIPNTQKHECPHCDQPFYTRTTCNGIIIWYSRRLGLSKPRLPLILE